MAHNLLDERFYGHREPAWHKLGTINDLELTAIEAGELIGAQEIMVSKMPMFVGITDTLSIETDMKALMREPISTDPQYRILGYCKDIYTIVQHKTLLETVNPLTNKDDQQYLGYVETAGLLGYGETLFMSVFMGDREVAGDYLKRYLVFADTIDGKTGLRIFLADVRPVCQNTLEYGERGAITHVKLRHTGDVAEELRARTHLLGQMAKVMGKIDAEQDLLVAVVLEEPDLERVINRAYPLPRKPRTIKLIEQANAEDIRATAGLITRADDARRIWEGAKEKVMERRTAVLELSRKFSDEFPNLAMTPWAVYNAVVEFEDFRPRAQGEADSADSAVFGPRAVTKARAYAAALEIAQEV